MLELLLWFLEAKAETWAVLEMKVCLIGRADIALKDSSILLLDPGLEVENAILMVSAGGLVFSFALFESFDLVLS